MTRRELLALLAMLGLAPHQRAGALIQSTCLKGRRIRWLVGWSAGGGYDTYARLAEPVLERAMDVEVVIDNQPGAGGRVAAVTLARARPDGRTIGILDGPGLLWAAASGERGSPDLENDFTLLARIARPGAVLMASMRSGIRTVADLAAAARQRRLVFGSTAPGSQSFVNAAVMTAALGIEPSFVVGYPGSREVLLGLVRGDFDLTSITAETAVDQIRAGDATPIVTVVPGANGIAGLEGVPSLDGAEGLLRRQPDLFPEPGRAATLTDAISRYLGAGRLVAAPAKLPDEIRRCFEEGFRSALGASAFQASARRSGRSLSVAFGGEMHRDVGAGRLAATTLVPVVADARRRIR